MSCLSVKITLLHSLLPSGVTINRISPPTIAITRSGGGIVTLVERATEAMRLSITDAIRDKHPKVSCGIVCSIADIHYLRVSPKEVQWITPSIGIIYTVESNTNWEVLTQ